MNIKVIIKDKNTLELAMDAKKGDIIRLDELEELDFSFIENLIESGKDKVYKTRIEELKKTFELQNQSEVEKTSAVLNKKHMEEITKLKTEIAALNVEKEATRKELHKDIETMQKEKELELQSKEKEIESKYIEEITTLKNKVKQIAESKEKELSELKLKHESDLRLKDNEINVLTRQKVALNVKQTGEDLEAWCNNTVTSYMQNGLFNCEWIKDNKVVKDEDEEKGSKADYLFKIYATENRKQEELVSSICLDMKDENPDSKNKKSNASYYKTLDKNRTKKQCKYAVLVSNLEIDKANDLPMYKVREYEDMYVVRPAYLMTFLNMITSLSTKFANLVLQDYSEKLKVKSATELMEEFDKLKKKYLDKPLESLRTKVGEIQTKNKAITDASNVIKKLCDEISNNYISEISDKLEKFDVGINIKYRKTAAE